MPTQVLVTDSNCGFKTLVTASKLSENDLALKLQSSCKKIVKAAEKIGGSMSVTEALEPLDRSAMYKAMSNCCVTCVVPCAVLKAFWVEAGFALKKDCDIHFR